MVLQKMLERRGLAVQCATSGEQALELAHTSLFDMVLMDVQMPGIGGAEAARRMRQLKRYSKVPIVALSGSGDEDMAMCFSAGMNDFMSKPVDMNELGEMVYKWLGFRTILQ